MNGRCCLRKERQTDLVGSVCALGDCRRGHDLGICSSGSLCLCPCFGLCVYYCWDWLEALGLWRASLALSRPEVRTVSEIASGGGGDPGFDLDFRFGLDESGKRIGAGGCFVVLCPCPVG